MQYRTLDTERWSDAEHQRARAGLSARAQRPATPQTGDLIAHPEGRFSRLWITDYSGEPYAVGEDLDNGFILSPDGTCDYTGTSGIRTNTRIELTELTGGTTYSPVEFWIDRLDEDKSCDVVSLAAAVRLWHTTTPAPAAD